MKQDTICAIATAPGGAIGIIRVSGPEAITYTSHIFRPRRSDKDLHQVKPYTLTFGQIIKPKSNDDEAETIIDEVLISTFHAPHSYTGEDCAEISCHGSSYILQTISQLLISSGCRGARPGEFTQRAFLNGKIDLSQAEAVADLIASSSEASHKLAMSQMRGHFSHELSALRDRLLHITSLLELELDFSDHEELEFADRTKLLDLACDIEQTIARLVNSFSLGNALKNGIPVAIIGDTNVGKSTLLNTLVGEERAIVSDIHGTTRDLIEDTLTLSGILFRFIDTAGIRHTTDTIENIGIERTFQTIERAKIVIWLIDVSTPEEHLRTLAEKILPHCTHQQIIIAFNKTDITPLSASKQEIAHQFLTNHSLGQDVIKLSLRQSIGIQELTSALIASTGLSKISESSTIVTNARHYEALTHALNSIRRVKESLHQHLSGDLVSEDLRGCIYHLSDIIGEVTTDKVLENIFSHFCIGK